MPGAVQTSFHNNATSIYGYKDPFYRHVTESQMICPKSHRREGQRRDLNPDFLLEAPLLTSSIPVGTPSPPKHLKCGNKGSPQDGTLRFSPVSAW